jgi:hypothetical protein
MAAGATGLFLTIFINGLRFDAGHYAWEGLSAALGLTVAVFAYLAWRPSLSRKGDVGTLVSIFFGFLAYTAFVQINLAILAARMRVR